jgi:hypothetical protein
MPSPRASLVRDDDEVVLAEDELFDADDGRLEEPALGDELELGDEDCEGLLGEVPEAGGVPEEGDDGLDEGPDKTLDTDDGVLAGEFDVVVASEGEDEVTSVSSVV